MKNLIKKILIIWFILISTTSCDTFVSKREKKFKEIEIKGIVLEKYRETWNHGSPVVKLSSGEIIGLVNWEKEPLIWSNIEIGDSIIKPLSSLDLIVYKKNGEIYTYKY